MTQQSPRSRTADVQNTPEVDGQHGASIDNDPDAVLVLEGLLAEQLHLYLAMDTVAVTQAKLADMGQFQRLADLTGKRQPLVDKLVEITRSLELFLDVIQSLAGDAEHNVTKLVRQSQQARARVMSLDDQLRRRLVQSKADASSRISHARQSGSAARAYASASLVRPATRPLDSGSSAASKGSGA